jgi:xanthine dehydrogenase accessory factor
MHIYSHLAELIEGNGAGALATVVSGELVGAKLLVPGEGATQGGIHADLDARIASDARELLAAERNSIREYTLGDGKVEVFIESFPPPQRLFIVGAVHIAIPLHHLAKMLGYYVTVIDPRSTLATPARFPAADSIMVEWPDDAMKLLGLDRGTSVVVLTHDPKFDHPALMAAVQSEARYVGAIGSRTTNERRMEALREEGVTEEQIVRIHAPIGLDIGAQTPAEIALAILSEIVATRYGRDGGHLKMKIIA